MSKVLGIACEDNGHFSAVTRLVDDTLVAAHDWLDGILESCRSWRGVAADERWYKYDADDVNDLRPFVWEGRRIRQHGHINGEPLKAGAGMWRRVLLLFCHSKPRPDVVVLVRDMDGYPGRLDGMSQVRDALQWPFKVALATPEPEVEAWRVAGFEAQNPAEANRLAELRKELSFDPPTQSHRLTSHPNDAATDAKRVLERLCEGHLNREDACLADRDVLRQRGAHNGAAAFLDEIDQHIVPLFSPGGP